MWHAVCIFHFQEQMLRKAEREVQGMSDWISVKDRMPDPPEAE